MNLILLTKGDCSGPDTAVLQGNGEGPKGGDRRFRQIRDIHQATVGDSVKVGMVNGLMGTAVITALSDDKIELALSLTQPPPEKLPLTLLLALPRPKMLRRIVRSVAELGVERLILINSYKVEKSFWQTPALEPASIRQYLIDGLQQAKDTQLPQVETRRLFKPFVEDELPSIVEGSTALVAHPGSAIACPQPLDKPLTLAIGPEGGFTPYEVAKLEGAGFETIHLGERILRVENAVHSLIAKLYSC